MIIVLATGNPGKLKEMEQYLAPLKVELRLKPPELDPLESGTTFRENACLKAATIAKFTGEWAIADDSGLEVDALNGAPGLFSARYGANDSDRINRLLTELGDNVNRRAQFVCAIALARPDGSIALMVDGKCQGEILYEPRGENGFGYDPIFYIRDQGLTFGEMSPEMKKKLSHRGIALTAFIEQFRDLNCF